MQSITPEQVQILRDVQRFGMLSKYHGLLPMKYAMLYDDACLRALLDGCLLEKGTVLAPCGNKLKGYKLTAKAEEALHGLGSHAGEAVESPPEIDGEELDAADMSVMNDVLHFSKVSRNAGLCPKDELHDIHGKKSVKRLYELGLILYVKMKGLGDKTRKGYVLSHLGRRVLRGTADACPAPAD